MKVLLISTSIFQLTPTGTEGYSGLEHLVALFALNLKRLGCEVSVVCPEGSNLGEGIEIVPVPYRCGEDVAFSIYKPRLIGGEFSAIEDHSWQWFSVLAQMEADRQLPIIHCYHSDPYNLGAPPPIANPCIVAFSEAQANVMRSRWNVACRVVRHGIDLDFYKPDPSVQRGNRYLYMARYSPEKGFLDIVHVVKKCRVPLDASGDTEIIANENYMRKCFEENDGRQIKVAPGLPRHETVKWYQSHKALITWPNYMEIFGLCVHPETPIDTKAGTIAINTLNPGCQVVGGDGIYRTVLSKTQREYQGNLVKITPNGIIIPVEVTPEHPCWIMPRRSLHAFTAPEWIPASEVREGDVLLFPVLKEEAILPPALELHYIRNTRNATIPPEVILSDNFWNLVGWYLAEGSTGANQGYLSLSFNSTEKAHHREVIGLLEETFNLPSHIREREDTRGVELQAYSSPVARLFDSLFGGHSWEKHLPEQFWPLPNSVAKIILRSYFLGDGYPYFPNGAHQFPAYSLTTVSRTLAHQVKHLLLRLGFVPTVSTYSGRDGAVIKGRMVKKQRPFYRIAIAGPQFDRFYREIMKNSLESDVPRERNYDYRFIHNGVVYLPVRKVERIPYKGLVYDIQVEGSSSFVSNGVLLHNTTVECMATGTPVISKDSGAARELIKHGKTGFVVSTLEELEDLIKSDAVSMLKPEDCRKRAEEFSIQKSAEGHLRCLQDVANGTVW